MDLFSGTFINCYISNALHANLLCLRRRRYVANKRTGLPPCAPHAQCDTHGTNVEEKMIPKYRVTMVLCDYIVYEVPQYCPTTPHLLANLPLSNQIVVNKFKSLVVMVNL